MSIRRLVPLSLLLAAVAGCAAASVATVTPGEPFDFPDAARAPFTAQVEGDFDSPFALAFLPDGTALVTEKGGTLRLWKPGGGEAVKVAGVPRVAVVGQGGLLDVAPAPDFATSHIVYLSYSEPRPTGSSLALARATLDRSGAPVLRDLSVIWRAGSDGAGGQFGAVIAFAPDGRSLFLASGERQRFTPAQDPDQALGKIVHLTPDGQPAPDNPGAGKTGAQSVIVTDPPADTEAAKTARGRVFTFSGPNRTPSETWSSGHRNPYGLAFDAAGNLWENEMGPRGGDEVNLILPGRNYGWPNVSYGDNYNGKPIPRPAAGDGYEPPKLYWYPSISPGGMLIYSGTAFPAWKGSMLIGALSGEALIRVALNGTQAAKADQWDMGTRIRDVAQAPDGSVWLLEDGGRGSGGRLIRLAPKH